MKIFLKKNKNFRDNQYVEKYNLDRKRFIKVFSLILILINITLFNINNNIKNTENEDKDRAGENKEVKIDRSKDLLNYCKSVEMIVAESRVYDFSLVGNEVNFKLSGFYSDRYIVELEEKNIIEVQDIIYNKEENFIEIKGAMK